MCAAIKREFGSDYFDDDGVLDRVRLNALIFDDVDARRRLNRIAHPAIRTALLKLLLYHAACACQFVILDIPLLFETKAQWYMHKTIVVNW
jgi:dephospho-CoA kinase